MPTYTDAESFRAAWQTAQRAAKRPKRTPRDQPPEAPTTTTRKHTPVERLALAGFMISVETGAGRHWFENKDGDRTPEGDDYAEARRLALAHIGET